MIDNSLVTILSTFAEIACGSGWMVYW